MVLPVKAEAKLEARVGESAVEKLVDAVVDTFSPISETAGLLGDVVRLARVEVATQITRRAKAIADENGLRLKAPPLKFLVPFYEKASTEEPDNAELMEMWSKLLVTAGSKYDARHLRYSAILAELSSDQAKIIQGIANNYGGTVGKDVDPDQLVYEFVEPRLTRRLAEISESDPDTILQKTVGLLCIAGVSVVIIQWEMKNEEKTMYDWTGDKIYNDSLSVDFEILRSIGLLERVATEFIELEHAALTATLYYLSELGFSFWSACCSAVKKRRTTGSKAKTA